jgi:hypothetical protein
MPSKAQTCRSVCLVTSDGTNRRRRSDGNEDGMLSPHSSRPPQPHCRWLRPCCRRNLTTHSVARSIEWSFDTCGLSQKTSQQTETTSSDVSLSKMEMLHNTPKKLPSHRPMICHRQGSMLDSNFETPRRTTSTQPALSSPRGLPRLHVV